MEVTLLLVTRSAAVSAAVVGRLTQLSLSAASRNTGSHIFSKEDSVRTSGLGKSAGPVNCRGSVTLRDEQL